MRERLAEKLLAKVLSWEPSDVARERPMLQAMASLKYDSYEQFSPGLRFIESLALWLDQFDAADREVAYQFVKSSLIFCSAEEMDHLVGIAYEDHIRPTLIRRTAEALNVKPNRLGRIVSSPNFRMLQRQTLFLGLSDGARIDSFRRGNPELNHEQIWQTHELSKERVSELLEKLSAHVKAILAAEDDKSYQFRSIVLLDDFSASGTSYYSLKPGGTTTGKIAKFLQALTNKEDPISRLCHPDGVDIIVLIYLATERAINYLSKSLTECSIPGVNSVEIQSVQLLPEQIKMPRGELADFSRLVEKYYDESIFDVHMQKGKTPDAKYGYADCGLPVILHHNTPNNSLAILWFYERCNTRGLFPRVQRHKEMS